MNRSTVQNVSVQVLIGRFTSDMHYSGKRVDLLFHASDTVRVLCAREPAEILPELLRHIEANRPTTSVPSSNCPGIWAWCNLLSHVGARAGISPRPSVDKPNLDHWIAWTKRAIAELKKKAEDAAKESQQVAPTAVVGTAA